MKRFKHLLSIFLMIFIMVGSIGSKCNADSLALNRIALIEYLILPPMSYSSFYASPSGFGSFSIGGSFASFHLNIINQMLIDSMKYWERF